MQERKGFGPKKIEDAVTEFLEGDWLTKTDTFVLCTRESLAPVARAKELEKQATKLKSQGITLIPWDRAELSLKLKGLPDIVHDFFSREWVEQFCGDEAAEKLRNRLDADEAAAFRAQLGEFYRHLFNNHDPGLPLFASADEPPPPLDTYISVAQARRLLKITHRAMFDLIKAGEIDLLLGTKGRPCDISFAYPTLKT